MIPIATNQIPELPAEIKTNSLTLWSTANSLVVQDATSLTEAKRLIADIRKTKKAIERFYEPIKSAINDLKTALMSEIKSCTEPLDEADKRLTEAALAYEAEMKRQAEEARLAAAEAAETALPWEAQPIVNAPIAAAAIPVVAGARTTKLPATAEVVDKRTFLTAALQPGNERMLEFVTFDQPALNAEARRLGQAIEQIYPGVRYVQRETIRVR